jgi:hypothetical protein
VEITEILRYGTVVTVLEKEPEIKGDATVSTYLEDTDT